MGVSNKVQEIPRPYNKTGNAFTMAYKVTQASQKNGKTAHSINVEINKTRPSEP